MHRLTATVWAFPVLVAAIVVAGCSESHTATTPATTSTSHIISQQQWNEAKYINEVGELPIDKGDPNFARDKLIDRALTVCAYLGKSGTDYLMAVENLTKDGYTDDQAKVIADAAIHAYCPDEAPR